ncbi:YitT family protein [Bacillus sp. SL00103]
MIISEKDDIIQKKITEEMERGVTVLKGVGSYTKQERNVLYCVVPKMNLSISKSAHDLSRSSCVCIRQMSMM